MDTARHLLDCCICRPFKSSTPLNLSRITKLLYIGSAWFRPHFARSLLISLDFSPSKTSLSHSKLHPQGFFWPRSSFSSLGKGPNPPFSFISCIWPNFLGFFFENFGVFQNWWSYCENFGIWFVKMVLNHHALHLICNITMFHAL